MKRNGHSTHHRPVRRDTSKVRLLSELYATLQADAESFERDKIGADLAYLIGAILKNGWCEWPSNRRFIEVLKKHCRPTHPVWRYVRVTDEQS